jgi:glyoxylase-like metal-dependent hydrolase (beta-lactamase superfamily II)
VTSVRKAGQIVLVLFVLTVVVRAQRQDAGRLSSVFDVLKVHGQVYLIAGPASNAVVQVGEQGVLVVDTMRDEDADALLGEIRTLARGRPIRYVVNTHAHLDHVGGNAKVSGAGTQLVGGNFGGQVQGDHAFIFAHEKVLNAVSAKTGGTSLLPFAGWPTDTFFQSEKDLYINGEGVQLIYERNAHTDGDVLVWFRGSDVIATGDVFDTTRMPEIDLKRGGHVNGVIEALNRIIDVAISEQFTEGGTRIVPGRGRICDEFDVVEYRDMVTIVRDRVQAMVKKGMTLQQVQAARPAFEYVPRYGQASAAAFVGAAYQNLRGQ